MHPNIIHKYKIVKMPFFDNFISENTCKNILTKYIWTFF